MKWPHDLGDGYTAVPFSAITLNGMFLPQLLNDDPGKNIAIIDPRGRALQGESGHPYRYPDLETAIEDVAVVKRLNAIPETPTADLAFKVTIFIGEPKTTTHGDFATAKQAALGVVGSENITKWENGNGKIQVFFGVQVVAEIEATIKMR